MSKRRHRADELPFSDGEVRNLAPDGLVWLDPQGKPPKLDERGRLLAPFVFVRDDGVRERLPAGMSMRYTPYTPRAWELVCEALEEARKKLKDGHLAAAEQRRVVDEALAPVWAAQQRAAPQQPPAVQTEQLSLTA